MTGDEIETALADADRELERARLQERHESYCDAWVWDHELGWMPVSDPDQEPTT